MIEINKIMSIQGDMIHLQNGTMKRATLPDMVQIATTGNNLIYGLDTSIRLLELLYTDKSVKLNTLRNQLHMAETVCNVKPPTYRDSKLYLNSLYGKTVVVKQYNDATAVIDGVSQSIDVLKLNRDRLENIVIQAKFWLHQNGVII